MRKAQFLGIVLVLAMSVGLAACGRKGPLEPPPGKTSDAGTPAGEVMSLEGALV